MSKIASHKGVSKTTHNCRKPKGNVRMAVTARAVWTKALPQVSATGGTDGHEEKGCMVCEKNDYQTEIVLCDSCDEEYHIFCLKPPLKYVPPGDWFCPSCSDRAMD
ncbi:unnamed protein product [Discosporangium mesarthrocarpum]